MSGAEDSRGSSRAVVSKAERKRFVEAVLAGKLTPSFAEVTYHFAGWLDNDVMDAVFEISSEPSEAVSALAGLSPATADGDEAPIARTGSKTSERVATSGSRSRSRNRKSTRSTPAVNEHSLEASKRRAMTIEALQAQKASVLSAAPSCVGGAARAESRKETPESVGDGSGAGAKSNLELEKVAAFISSYAGEQEAAAKAARVAAKPPKPPFFVPRGTVEPSTRKVHLVIANTAEKTVEVPGFEAFMKMQHGKDALFRFLGTEHPLHSYYLLAKRHAQETVVKGGKAKGACTAAPLKAPAPKTEDPEVLEIMQLLGGLGP